MTPHRPTATHTRHFLCSVCRSADNVRSLSSSGIFYFSPSSNRATSPKRERSRTPLDTHVLAHVHHSPSPKIRLDGLTWTPYAQEGGSSTSRSHLTVRKHEMFPQEHSSTTNLAVRGASLDSRVTGKGGLEKFVNNGCVIREGASKTASSSRAS